jgi:NAD-dependent SIR2 family protein deacetylase
MEDLEDTLKRAANAIQNASTLVYMTGAGMSHDSGMDTYRGKNALDFGKQWPPMKARDIGFYQLAKPRLLLEEPVFVWSYYKVRWDTYNRCVPHAGYRHMASWARQVKGGAFSFTSNVDGLWKYPTLMPGNGNSTVAEYHGSIHRAQCAYHGSLCLQGGVWDAQDTMGGLQLDSETHLLTEQPPLPSCGHCGRLARLNVFGIADKAFNETVRTTQMGHYETFKSDTSSSPSVVVVEVGAGRSIPTVRCESAWWTRHKGATLIRINLESPAIEDPHIIDADVAPDARHISIGGLGAMSALSAIHSHMK